MYVEISLGKSFLPEDCGLQNFGMQQNLLCNDTVQLMGMSKSKIKRLETSSALFCSRNYKRCEIGIYRTRAFHMDVSPTA
jgi:hypothetical protein